MIETVIITKEDLEKIHKSIDELNNKIETILSPDYLQFVDNDEFLKIMKVSKRTAQVWRDEGLLTFVQIGSKIYYRHKDIGEFLEDNEVLAFNKNKGSKLIPRRINYAKKSGLESKK